MSRIFAVLLFITLAACKTTGAPQANFDATARELQQKLNDTHFAFYHDKHPPVLEQAFTVPADFVSEREIRGGSFVYRLRVQPDGQVAFRTLKAPPPFLAARLEQILKELKFRPAWIAERNYAAEIDVHFVMEYDAH